MAVKSQQEDNPFNMGQDFLDFVNQTQQTPDAAAAPGGNHLVDESQGDQTGKDRGGNKTPGNGPNPDAPRPQPPPPVTPPSPEAGNPSSAQPPAPTSPTPAPPIAYNPLPAPSPEDLIMSPLGKGTLTGSAGGLLGGGLGTTGNVEEGKGDSLLPLLMKLLQQQGQ